MSGNKKAVIIVVALLAICCVLPVCAFFALAAFSPTTLEELGVDYNFDFDTTFDSQNQQVESGEEKYENQTYNFSLIMPEDWKTEESGKQVIINPEDGNGSINFEAFDDSSFSTFEGIDQEFCDSFGEGFRSGLGVNEEIASQFTFSLFSLNGNTGCRAEGSLFEGVNQRYYVFFNNDNDKVYSIFYTATSTDNEDELAEVMDSFDF